MGLDRIKRDINPEGKSSQVEQLRDKKESETSDQRLERYTWSFRDLSKTGFVTFTLAMAGIVGGIEGSTPASSDSALALRGSDNVTVLLPALNQKEFNNLSHWSALEFDPGRVTPELLDHLRKVGVQDPEQLIGNVQQGKYDGEISSEQKESSKNEGKEPLSSNGEKIDPLPSLMDKLKENPQSLRKMLNERAMRGRSLSEAPTASGEQATCSDPCSDTPASIDCIKECTTANLMGDAGPMCLDISTSGVSARIENASGRLIPGPGQQVHLDYHLNVQNNCQQAVNKISFQVDGSSMCPPGTSSSIADEPRGFWPGSSALPDPNLVIAPGNFAGVKGSSDWFCMMSTGFDSENYTIPSELSVIVSAQAWTNTGPFYSRGKKFTVLGSVNDGVKPCDQKCSPSHRHKGPNGGAVAGGVIGAMGALAIAAWCCCCRRKDHSEPVQPRSDARGPRILESPRRRQPRPIESPSGPGDVHPRPAEPSSGPLGHDSLPNPRMPSERMGFR